MPNSMTNIAAKEKSHQNCKNKYTSDGGAMYGMSSMHLLTLASLLFNNWQPTWRSIVPSAVWLLLSLSEEFLLGDESSEQARSSMGSVIFWSMEFEFSVFTLSLLNLWRENKRENYKCNSWSTRNIWMKMLTIAYFTHKWHWLCYVNISDQSMTWLIFC